MDAAVHNAYKAALNWYIEQGVDEALRDVTVNRFSLPEHEAQKSIIDIPARVVQKNQVLEHSSTFLGTSEAYADAVKKAASAKTIEDLHIAIANFEGISLKKTSTNMVFSDGHIHSSIMIIGDVPGTDEDRVGKSFSGNGGELLNKILSSIQLSRSSEEPLKSVYLSNVLNWRPPGNRSPSASEIELSLPFIERHIQLIQPKILILCGGVAAQALLGRTESISKLRGTFHIYRTLTEGLQKGGIEIPSLVTYAPSYLLTTPSQKKAVWSDMLKIAQKIALFT